MLKPTKSALICGVSAAAVLALLQPAPSHAQTADQSQGTTVGELVITARRAAIESATEIKRNADTVVDAVVADEAGKLPDTSITEVLQRVPGVTMTRFASLGSPDQYSWEGSGIQIRGLSGVTGLLNGREVFSANGGSGLNWGDVTPELMAAVNVYKESTADLIEGGTGGAVDLRTRMPFDYHKPEVDVSLSDSYGDFAKRGSPSASILMTDRFDTPIGEFGALIDLSYSRFLSADSFVRSEPYYQTTYNGQTVYVPGGFDYGNDNFDRTRKGLYAAFEWRPTENLRFFQTDFVSNYRQVNGGGGVFAVDDESDTVVNGVFNTQGIFQKGSIQARNAASGFYPGNSNNYTPSSTTTSDFSQGFDYTGDRLHLSGAFQVVLSGAGSQDYGLGVGSAPISQENLDFTGSIPSVAISNPQVMVDPSRATINDIIWNHQKNHAQMSAVNLDLEYDLGDGFFKKFKAGARFADRRESDTFEGTWWSPTGRGWNGVPQATVATAPASDFEVYDFPDFFKGRIPVPGNYYMAASQILRGGAFLHDVMTYASCSPNGYYQCSTPGSSNYLYGNPPDPNFGNPPSAVATTTKTYDIYEMVRFASDGVGWLPEFSGNAGLRVVRDKVRSTGSFNFAGGQTYYLSAADAAASLAQIGGVGNLAAWENSHPGQPLPLTYTSVASTTTRTESNTYTRALPSINVAFKPDRAWVVRLAYSKTLSPPNYSDIRATGSGGISTTPNPTAAPPGASLPNIFNGYTYSAGDTHLKPAVSTNEDVSIEWYPKPSTTAHVDFFNKDIKDLIIYNDFSLSAASAFGSIPTVSQGAGGPTTVPGVISGQADFNAGKVSNIKGLEIGGRTYFDMLPSPFRGFGLEANFTYIDSRSPDARATDMNGNRITGVPIVGLSKYNYNINLLYDLGRWDARLAYNWRSRYLATTTGNGTTGNYNVNGGANVKYSLPVYGSALGQLDGSVSYKVNQHVQLSADFTNLLNVVSRTEMEILPGQFVTRSWFINDRRVALSVRTSF